MSRDRFPRVPVSATLAQLNALGFGSGEIGAEAWCNNYPGGATQVRWNGVAWKPSSVTYPGYRQVSWKVGNDDGITVSGLGIPTGVYTFDALSQPAAANEVFIVNNGGDNAIIGIWLYNPSGDWTRAPGWDITDLQPSPSIVRVDVNNATELFFVHTDSGGTFTPGVTSFIQTSSYSPYVVNLSVAQILATPASSSFGQPFFCTDLTGGAALIVSDGTNWNRVAPHKMRQVITTPGTIGANTTIGTAARTVRDPKTATLFDGVSPLFSFQLDPDLPVGWEGAGNKTIKWKPTGFTGTDVVDLEINSPVVIEYETLEVF